MSSVGVSMYTLDSPHYRRFDLPWTRVREETERLRKIAWIVLAVLAVFAVGIPFLSVPKVERSAAVEIPPRLAKLVIEKKSQPPPPPVVEEQAEPVVESEPEIASPKPIETPPEPETVVEPEPLPEPQIVAKIELPEPVVQPPPSREQIIEQAREKARSVGLLAAADDLASLRDDSVISNTGGSHLAAGVDSGERTQRALITSKSGRATVGVDTGSFSRNTGGGGLASHTTATVAAPTPAVRPSDGNFASSGSASSNQISPGTPSSSTSGNGSFKGQRSQEEIEMVFDQNKAAIYALYRRALRRDPTLQGKLVLELTIAPTGQVVSCRVVSSELGAPEFEESLVKRVKRFNFGARDVDQITTTKPIDFFPA